MTQCKGPSSTLLHALKTLKPQPFLATLATKKRQGKQIVLHYSRNLFAGRLLRRRHSESLKLSRSIAHEYSVRVKYHSDDSLTRPTSIQTLLEQFSAESVAYDPTGAFQAATRLMSFARDVRNKSSESILGMYWSARWQTAYIIVDRKICGPAGYTDIDKLASLEQVIIRLYRNHFRKSDDTLSFAIRLCLDMPHVCVVPIDAGSISSNHSKATAFWKLARVPTLAVLFGLSSFGVASAASGPGLSESNSQQLGERITMATKSTTSSEMQASPARPASTALDAQKYVGGHGLHDFWRTRAGTRMGAAKGEMNSGGDRIVHPRGGSLFGPFQSDLAALPLDLQWSGGGVDYLASELSRSGRLAADEARRRRNTDPGVSALPGLSGLVRGTMTDEDFCRLLEELQSEFGLLPLAIYRNCRNELNHTSLRPTEFKLAQQTFWDWLKDNKKNDPNNPQDPNWSPRDPNRDRATRRWSSSQ